MTLNHLKLNLDKLDANVDFIWHSKTRSQKRAIKKYFFEVHSNRSVIQDTDQETRIHVIYSLFAIVDIYALQTMFSLKDLSKIHIYVYLILRSIRRLNYLNDLMKENISALKKSRKQKPLTHRQLLHKQVIIDSIGLEKITQLQSIEHYLGLSELSLNTIMERLNEEHVN